jgi:DNA helicase-2/ATP-dependent DNA helicase PcrA
LIRALRAIPPRPVQAIVEAVLQKSDYEKSLIDDEGNEQLANVRELVTAARQYDLDNPTGSLIDWLQQISLMTDADSLQLAGGPVTLMTLHTAKGLEFPVVYIAGLEEDVLPHSRAVRSGEPDDIEEERRLFFVGITRAKESLTLTHAKYRMTRGITERAIISRFTRELPEEQIERQTFQNQRDRSRAHLSGYNDSGRDIDSSGYYAGQRVKHEDYGVGEVLRLDRSGRSTVIRIHFRDFGERSFALEHVSLYVLDGEC